MRAASIANGFSLLGAVAAPNAAAQLAMRAPTWTGVERIVLQCDVAADTGIAAADFCATALAMAKTRSPYPVESSGTGREVAILSLTLRNVGGTPSIGARVRRAIELDDAESGTFVSPRPLDAERGLAADLADVIDLALPRARGR